MESPHRGSGFPQRRGQTIAGVSAGNYGAMAAGHVTPGYFWTDTEEQKPYLTAAANLLMRRSRPMAVTGLNTTL